MVIVELKPHDVVAGCRRVLGLPTGPSTVLDEPFLAAMVRRSAGINCPCSQATLRRSLVESLKHLHADADELQNAIQTVIEKLVVAGDLLDIRDVTTSDAAARGTWLFAAPPSFVLRRSGTAILLGIVPDQDSFLPRSLADRVTHHGVSRFIDPAPDENLSEALTDQGLQQLSDAAWIKGPRKTTAAELLRTYEQRLAKQPSCGTLTDLQIIDPTRPATYYKGRWMPPTTQTGNFVAKRPQEFGAPIWCMVELERGAPRKLLDLPANPVKWRGCDVAWHLQLAIDDCRGAPQRYRVHRANERVRLDFFSPLPVWAERRLLVIGQSASPERCLLSYWIPEGELMAEEEFLQHHLWLNPSDTLEAGTSNANN